MTLIGRSSELEKIRPCLMAKKNVLLEGPVGVGKTFLALSVTEDLKLPVFRIDGDNRFTEQKLVGFFDPPLVLKKGYCEDTFVPGPLLDAMQKGGVLFINELNRLPEGVQNVLLPAIDERKIVVPRLGEIQASPKFLVVATQNPKEFVATSHLSEALLDRFELVVLDYQSEEEEVSIVSQTVKQKPLVQAAVKLVRATRNHPKIRRGASVRAAQSISEIAAMMMKDGLKFEDALREAALIALPTRIELERDAESEISTQELIENLIKALVQEAMSGTSHKVSSEPVKKK
jgi:MoxR-like ATPase